ncbi:MAG: hypothetical protein FJ303_07020 [Planctomycetes bacterium]|nr:hypothetical protein [Planctomycetota bacterium]
MTTWLLTSTFYGQGLPGDKRGSVTNVRDRRPDDPEKPCRLEHALRGHEFDQGMPGLERAAQAQLKGPPVALDLEQAEQLLDQFQETARDRGWDLLAASIMHNHIHLVVSAPPEVGKSELLRDLKSYGSRRLNKQFGQRASGTWWSESGSCRPMRQWAAAIFYVCHRQARPSVVWRKERGRIPPAESDPKNVLSE